VGFRKNLFRLASLALLEYFFIKILYMLILIISLESFDSWKKPRLDQSILEI